MGSSSATVDSSIAAGPATVSEVDEGASGLLAKVSRKEWSGSMWRSISPRKSKLRMALIWSRTSPQVRLAHHLIDMGLEFRRHAPGLLDHVGDGPDGDRHVLRPDQDQGDGGDQA